LNTHSTATLAQSLRLFGAMRSLVRAARTCSSSSSTLCAAARFSSTRSVGSSNSNSSSSSNSSNISSGAVSVGDAEGGARRIQWYPGHIAKAERELSAYLKHVDVVIEVRDARIPLATRHPSVPSWVGERPLIVVIVRIDQITNKALGDWRTYFDKYPAHPERPDVPVFFVNSKTGEGVPKLKNKAITYNSVVNAKRDRFGIQPRAARAAIIGFPNVGKSALINKLLGKTMARSRNLPGVTRSMQWVRLGGSSTGGNQENEIDLLDSPGIIPAKHLSQVTATRLAMCNDIGGASYDPVVVAAALVDELNSVYREKGARYFNMEALITRYHKIPFDTMRGEDFINSLAELKYEDCAKTAATKLLGDFRSGKLGRASLEHFDMRDALAVTTIRDSKRAIAAAKKPKPKGQKKNATQKVKSNTSVAGAVGSAEDADDGLDNLVIFEDEDEIIDKGEYDGW
jgi:ribosome biogenesis GTPase A